MRCTRGAMDDVIVDLRPASATRGRWTAVELDATSGRALYVPKGFAHGFQTLEDHTDVLYMISNRYAPEAATGFEVGRSALCVIVWPETSLRTISERDRSWPDFEGP